MPKLGPAHAALIEVLIAERQAAGLTQREVGDRIKRPHSFIGKIETGTRHINLVEFIEVARALEVEPTKLLAKVVKATGL
jgi:transcriptional regulator with XRE-family HTH domain